MKLTITCIFVSKPHLLLFPVGEACVSRHSAFPVLGHRRLKQLPVGMALGLWDEAPTGTLPSCPIYKLVLQQLPERKALRNHGKEESSSGIRYFWESIKRTLQIRGEIARPMARGSTPWYFSIASGAPWGPYCIS